MSWSAIRAEYAREVIGVLLFEEVRRAVEQVCRRYDPLTYAGTSNWSDAVDDVVQDLISGLLLGEGQLAYIMRVAQSVDALRRLLALQVRRLLARNRRRTVIDNLLDRARALLAEAELESQEDARGRIRYRLFGGVDKVPSDDEIWHAARLVALVPRVGVGHSDRAPLVYTDRMLAQVLLAFAREVGCWFSVSDLDRLFRLILTDLLPESLEQSSEAADYGSDGAGSSVESATVTREAAKALHIELSPDECAILRGKSIGESDESLARRLDVSRPTLAKRKTELFGRMENHLAGLSRVQQLDVLDQVNALIVLGGVDT